MAHALRADARLGQPVIEKGGYAIAEGMTDGGVNGRQHLEQDEDDSSHCERACQALPALHCRHEDAHRDREDHRQDAAQQQCHPPGEGERAIGLGQDGEEHPFLALTQSVQQTHERRLVSWMFQMPGTRRIPFWGHRAPVGQRLSVTLCTRQLVISPTSNSVSLRQSSELARPNSLGSLPAAPNLPTTLPSSCTL